jgi:hypothetical protein
MSEEKSIFERNDFNNIYFYYFLPFYNYVKKIEIGEKINQFNGVIIYKNYNNFFNIENQYLLKRKYLYFNRKRN